MAFDHLFVQVFEAPIEMLQYFAIMGFKIPRWRDEARAAQLIAGAVENKGI